MDLLDNCCNSSNSRHKGFQSRTITDLTTENSTHSIVFVNYISQDVTLPAYKSTHPSIELMADLLTLEANKKVNAVTTPVSGINIKCADIISLLCRVR